MPIFYRMSEAQAETAIDARGLSKVYRIWSSPAARLRSPVLWSMSGMVPAWGPFGRLRRNLREQAAVCWRSYTALRPLDLQVPRGQCLGIVGRNGSGKSTLLQLICGVLQPSSGSVAVRGRVAALLELGSGFNPDFTGRENVYLNASILGLSRKEVDDRFDDIAEFADIGDFVEQPVKTYSSGMMLRLAFAVQILVDPDVLIVDEALAVGDEPFQRKCFARIERLREQGVTVLFVSHDMTPIITLCDRALLLHKGELIMDGSPKDVSTAYQRFNHAPPERAEALLEEMRRAARGLPSAPADEAGPTNGAPGAVHPSEVEAAEILHDAPGEEPLHPELFDPALRPESTQVYDTIGATIGNLRLLDSQGRRVNHLRRRDFYLYCYTVDFQADCEGVNFAMLIKTLMGAELGGARGAPAHRPIRKVAAGTRYEVCFRFQCNLNPGAYCMNAGVEALVDGKPTYAHRVIDALIFKVRPEQDLLPTVTVDFLVEPSFREAEASTQNLERRSQRSESKAESHGRA